jgi:predicted nucleic acid-binding protein
MRVLLDTSVLVAAMVEDHPDHRQALPWLQQVNRGVHIGHVAAHSLAELYAILTRLPVQPRISPELAHHLIEQNVLSNCTIISLSDQDYIDILTHMSASAVSGGVIYDALILYAAIKVEIDQILTLNVKDFQRIFLSLADKVTSP